MSDLARHLEGSISTTALKHVGFKPQPVITHKGSWNITWSAAVFRVEVILHRNDYQWGISVW